MKASIPCHARKIGSQSPQRQHCPKFDRLRLSIITLSLSMFRLGLWWAEVRATNKRIVSPEIDGHADSHQQ